MVRFINKLLGLNKKGKRGKKSVKKNSNVLRRLQVTCLRETVAHEQKQGLDA